MSDFKSLLTIKKSKEPVRKNILEVAVEMDADPNDGDYVNETFTFTLKPEELFENEKLIYCLAYVSCDQHSFKKEILKKDINYPAFDSYIGENKDIDDLEDILYEAGFIGPFDSRSCISFVSIDITWYDETCQPHDITFDDIIDQFKKMTYQEICDKINSIK